MNISTHTHIIDQVAALAFDELSSLEACRNDINALGVAMHEAERLMSTLNDWQNAIEAIHLSLLDEGVYLLSDRRQALGCDHGDCGDCAGCRQGVA